VFVLVFSAASNASNHVEHEVDRAVSCGLPILPLRVEDVMPCGSLEFYLAGQHWLDALTPPLEDHLSRLSEAITVLLQLPAKGRRPPLTDEWRGVAPEAAKSSPVEPVAPRSATVEPAAPVRAPAAAVTEKPPDAVKPPVVPSPVTEKAPEGVKPPPVPPPITKRPAEDGKPAVAPSRAAAAADEPPEVVKRPESVKPPVTPPPVTRTPPKVAEPPAATRPAPVAPAPAAVASPRPVTEAKRPAKPGRRPALIAAAVVGASWIGVLLAVELLFR
jgi:hypothetical protein